MYGFLVSNKEIKTIDEFVSGSMIVAGGYYFFYNPMNKFQNDKLFYEDENKVVLLDGVVLNIDELKKEYNKTSWKEVFDYIYQNSNSMFMDKLRGSFCGVVYDKTAKEIIAFTNHSGERAAYYYKNEDCLMIANHIFFIKSLLEQAGNSMNPCIQGCYEMLITGSCLSHNTPYSNVHRITAGKFISVKNNIVAEDYYHFFSNLPEHDLDLDECIERGDVLFRQAVDRIFRKNTEYGYQGECDLSGGLDSRMATWVAHDLGYRNILNVCYCVKNHLDQTISQKMANDLGNEYYFLPMDSNIFRDIDKKVTYTGGQIDYTLSTGAVKVLETIDNNIGMCCTGLLGEIQNAYWVEGEEHTKPKYWRDGIHERTKMVGTKFPSEYGKIYENYEQMNLYELSYNFYMSSAISRQQLVEVVSPFVDVDYLDFIYKVPLKWRRHYKYVLAWMTKKYPKATMYKWASTGRLVNKSCDKEFNLSNRVDIVRFFRLAVNKMLRMVNVSYCFDSKFDMNPFEKWYKTDKEIRDYLDDYFEKNIGLVSVDSLKEDMVKMFKDGDHEDKLLVNNLLAAFKNFMTI